ncbi:sugar transferase [Rhodococcus daqingensis]|uniref:Sugar transferase n=1 Tax=Rhodococcus daqingensis TaxID=2479363 RepID=A0ABW2RSR9_9NOCA
MGATGVGLPGAARRSHADAPPDRESTAGPVRPQPVRRGVLTGHIRRLKSADAVVIAGAVGLAQLVRFGDQSWDSAFGSSVVVYTGASLGIAALWWMCLSLEHAHEPQILGRGLEEYRRVALATVKLFGAIAVLSTLFGVTVARGYLAIALPVGLIGLIVGRWTARRYLARRRRAGDLITRVLVLGGGSSAIAMMESFARAPESGYRVVGACIPEFRGEATVSMDRGVPLRCRANPTIAVGEHEVPILGDENRVLDAIDLCAADTVAVTATDQIGHDRMRDLGWALHERDIDLIVAPLVTDFAGPRIRIQPTAGMPLMHVDEPRYEGASRFGKTVFDRVGAIAAVLSVLPVLLVVAALIKCGDGGPVFYRQTRVGQDGREFRMWKFRTMVTDADQLLAAVKAETEDGDGAFFKARHDPRITPIGRLLRSTSIDELPQLFNVVTGDMSLVGPRPLQRGEGAEFDGFVERRMVVRPGMTGLWQVSGRSSLSEDERVRLDLSYVENWSMLQDLLIIAKTIRAVTARDGAY